MNSDISSNQLFSNENLTNSILAKLEGNTQRLRADFQNSAQICGTRFLSIDDMLPLTIAKQIWEQFPKSIVDNWRKLDSFRERKWTANQFQKLPLLLGQITFAMQDDRVVKAIQDITEMSQLMADPTMYAGGLSMMRHGDFLNPHIDNSHDEKRASYRRLNLLYYVTPEWNLADGGHLELWDQKVKKNHIIQSQFNRLVLMETHHKSWHSVSPVEKSDGMRCCVSNYYFSPVSPTGNDYFHVTSFQGRPGQHFRRAWSTLDNSARMAVRKIFKNGVVKTATFDPKNHSN